MQNLQLVVSSWLLPLTAGGLVAGLLIALRRHRLHLGPPAPRAWKIFVLAMTTLLAVGSVALGTGVYLRYDWAMFLSLPVVIGLFSTLLLSLAGARSYRSSLGVACQAVVSTGIGLLITGIEGALCLIMALPLAFVLTAAGVALGHGLQKSLWSRRHAAALLVITALATPLLMGAAGAERAAPAVYAVRTAVEIQAPPDVVWRHVIAFPALPAERDSLFHTGIAYPLRAEIRGRGAGAVRYCVFSTGAFVEPIEVWDAPRLLRFAVTQSPPAMVEMSPYAIHPPHLEGFLVSRRGQFALEPLPGGRTRLVGTTWYEHGLQPAGYWRLWSDWILHRIHRRVLEHVKRLAEAEVPAA
jgi:hypothetical protein